MEHDDGRVSVWLGEWLLHCGCHGGDCGGVFVSLGDVWWLLVPWSCVTDHLPPSPAPLCLYTTHAYRYAKKFPAKAAEFNRRFGADGYKLPEDWAADIPTWSPEDKALATRKSSAAVLNALAKRIPEMIGGSADLSPSNYTELKGDHDFQKATPDGRYIRFGVREHGMTSICNGIAAFGGFVPFCATFLNFCGYALGAVRVTALSHFRVLFVYVPVLPVPVPWACRFLFSFFVCFCFFASSLFCALPVLCSVCRVVCGQLRMSWAGGFLVCVVCVVCGRRPLGWVGTVCSEGRPGCVRHVLSCWPCPRLWLTCGG